MAHNTSPDRKVSLDDNKSHNKHHKHHHNKHHHHHHHHHKKPDLVFYVLNQNLENVDIKSENPLFVAGGTEYGLLKKLHKDPTKDKIIGKYWVTSSIKSTSDDDSYLQLGNNTICLNDGTITFTNNYFNGQSYKEIGRPIYGGTGKYNKGKGMVFFETYNDYVAKILIYLK